jgi:mono/diheme cytochrome c family protein
MKWPFDPLRAGRRILLGASAFASALLVAGCTVEFENPKAARDAERLSNPAGSVYAGWRVFQDKCARCHGAAATGTASAPDLLPSVRDMGSRQFLSLVLRRYDWNQQAPQARSNIGAREAAVDVIMQRKDAPLTMPAWQGEPSVDAHVLDLYAYLSARAQGTQDAGRPAP